MANLRPTKFSNLDRDKSTGTYYARVKVGVKRKVKSLGTDNLSTPRRKLTAALEQMRGELERGVSRAIIFKLAEQYRQRSEANPNLSPKTKLFHKEIVGIFLKNWKGPQELHVVKLNHLAPS